MKKSVFLLVVVLFCLMMFSAFADVGTPQPAEPDFDAEAYSYDELLEINRITSERIANLERQYAIEHGDRKISLGEEEALLFEKKSLQLSPQVTRIVDTAPEKTELVFSSSNETVATVSAKGLVTAVANGSAEIVCSAKDNDCIFSVMKIQVVSAVAKVTVESDIDSLLLKKAAPELATVQLHVKIEPEEAYCKTVTWSSSDAEIATVDENGLVHALKAGKVIISVVSNEEMPGGSPKSSSYTLSVNQSIEEISFDLYDVQLFRGKTQVLSASVFPENATSPKYSWSSTNEEVATIKAGTITAVGKGECEIVATAEDGSEVVAKCHVSVVEPVKTLALEGEKDVLLLKNDAPELAETMLKAIIEPEDAFCQTVSWVSSDEEVVTVGKDGFVHALKAGKATITATSDEELPGSTPKKASYTITVKQSVEGISIDKEEMRINKGKTAKVSVTVFPEEATTKTVTWSSSDPSVATVSAGTITAKDLGTCTITATANDGSEVTAAVEVTVIKPISAIKFAEKEIIVNYHEGGKLKASITPTDASIQELVWESSDPTIVEVNQNGALYANKCGCCTINCTTTDGSKLTASIQVRVPSISAKKEYLITKKLANDYGYLSPTIIPITYYGNGRLVAEASSNKYFIISEVNKEGNTVNLSVIPKRAGTETVTLSDSRDPNDSVAVKITISSSAVYPEVKKGEWCNLKGEEIMITSITCSSSKISVNRWAYLNAPEGSNHIYIKAKYRNSSGRSVIPCSSMLSITYKVGTSPKGTNEPLLGWPKEYSTKRIPWSYQVFEDSPVRSGKELEMYYHGTILKSDAKKNVSILFDAGNDGTIDGIYYLNEN